MSKEGKKTVDKSTKIDEETKSNEVDNGATETKKVEETEKVDGTAKETTQASSEEPKKDESNETAETETEGTETTEDNANTVEQTEQQGNGISINDLVTKDMLAERLSALEAKFDAVVKENIDLKDALSKAKDETDGLRDKYENKDFGSFSSQRPDMKDKTAYETFESYSKKFM